ncbi:hypothetical protein [Rhizobium sp. Root1220]|uniref:hypothetical protein n=1 Tax=Rhizobium sp. Root1220 TaxID=1736432 RepID=UPI000700E371|nr:hypothetical protein [Rhizobium sp. Root1220]KQV82062.1 hypothetical protein ASC90_23375 [Rhizobium sp. Root1220]
MRNLLIVALSIGAPFFVASNIAIAAECEINVTKEILDPNVVSPNGDLAQGIVCLAIPVTIEASDQGRPTADDATAARNIVVLANKIIGNGSPADPTNPKILSSTAPVLAALSTWPSGGTGGASLQKKQLTPGQLHSIASMLKCRALALIGDPPPKCGTANWNKGVVIEMAGKIIGNG